jgi:transposase
MKYTHPMCRREAAAEMKILKQKYSEEFMRMIARKYSPNKRGSGYQAIANLYELPSPNLVKYWVEKYKETKGEMKNRAGGNRKRKLDDEECEEHVRKFVVQNNRDGIAVTYKDVQNNVKKRTRKDVSLRTVQRYGKELCALVWKRTTRKLEIEGALPMLSPPDTHTLVRYSVMMGMVHREG